MYNCNPRVNVERINTMFKTLLKQLDKHAVILSYALFITILLIPFFVSEVLI